jgi:Uma2 family endonuclease
MRTEAIPKLTYEQFRELPEDGKRYELIRGEVHLTPAPTTRHQFIVMNLAKSLSYYLDTNSSGEIAIAPLDVRLTSDTAVQPDLIFISNAKAGIILEEFIAGSPDLVVEVLSPSTAAHDRATKLALYADAGVPEVWVIDPQAKTVEVLKLEGSKYLVDSILAGSQTLSSTRFPGWKLALKNLFDFRGRF